MAKVCCKRSVLIVRACNATATGENGDSISHVSIQEILSKLRLLQTIFDPQLILKRKVVRNYLSADQHLHAHPHPQVRKRILFLLNKCVCTVDTEHLFMPMQSHLLSIDLLTFFDVRLCSCTHPAA